MALAALVPARNEETLLPETLSALKTLPDLCRILVIDDKSTDNTKRVAEACGAEVLRAGTGGGKGGAVLGGLRFLRGDWGGGILICDADLGASAVHLGELVGALGGGSPFTIASFSAKSSGGFGLVKDLARRVIAGRSRGSFIPSAPLSGQRAFQAPVLEHLPGVAPGFGCEVGMTLDLLDAGIIPREIPLPLAHRGMGKTPAGFVHRALQGLDVARAVRGERLPW